MCVCVWLEERKPEIHAVHFCSLCLQHICSFLCSSFSFFTFSLLLLFEDIESIKTWVNFDVTYLFSPITNTRTRISLNEGKKFHSPLTLIASLLLCYRKPQFSLSLMVIAVMNNKDHDKCCFSLSGGIFFQKFSFLLSSLILPPPLISVSASRLIASIRRSTPFLLGASRNSRQVRLHVSVAKEKNNKKERIFQFDLISFSAFVLFDFYLDAKNERRTWTTEEKTQQQRREIPLGIVGMRIWQSLPIDANQRERVKKRKKPEREREKYKHRRRHVLFTT